MSTTFYADRQGSLLRDEPFNVHMGHAAVLAVLLRLPRRGYGMCAWVDLRSKVTLARALLPWRAAEVAPTLRAFGRPDLDLVGLLDRFAVWLDRVRQAGATSVGWS
jgi:hypothetical protein